MNGVQGVFIEKGDILLHKIQLIPLLTKPEEPGLLFCYWQNLVYESVEFFSYKGSSI